MIAAMDRHLGAFTIAFFGVALTLLVISFSAVPYCTYDGPSVNLPWAKTAAFLIDSDRDLRIRLSREETFQVGPALVPGMRLQSELHEIFLRTPDRRVVVQADGAVRFGAVQHAVASARLAGFREIYLITLRGTALEAVSRDRAAN